MRERFTKWLEPTTIEECSRVVAENEIVISSLENVLLQNLNLPWAPGVYSDFLLHIFEDVDDLQLMEGEMEHAIAQAKNFEFQGVTSFRPALSSDCTVFREDFVAIVPATKNVKNLNALLERYGLCLPFAHSVEEPDKGDQFFHLAGYELGFEMSIGELVGWNIPNLLEAQHGTWQNWVLGGTYVMANGDIVSSGSRVAKNVAGFDFHKFLIGSRSAFAIPLLFILRLIPLSSLKSPVVKFAPKRTRSGVDRTVNWAIHRVPKTRFDEKLNQLVGEDWFADPLTCTVFQVMAPNQSPQRFEGDWLARMGTGMTFPVFTKVEKATLRRAKKLFDPTNKLNPGILGVV